MGSSPKLVHDWSRLRTRVTGPGARRDELGGHEVDWAFKVYFPFNVALGAFEMWPDHAAELVSGR